MRRFILLALALTVSTCCAFPITRPDAPPVDPTELVSRAPDPAPVEVPPETKLVRITMQGHIDGQGAAFLVSVLEKLKNVEFVLLEINSGGGEVEPGFVIAKAIENHPAAIACIVDGEAASQAFYILQSCPLRYMTARSKLMAHEPFYYSDGTALTREYLKQALVRHEVEVQGWTEHAGARMVGGADGLRAKIRDGDWYMNADEALKVGAVDGIVDSVLGVQAKVEAGLNE